ncbi:MAG: dihydropyrimidinase [Candidatus Kapaibacterium sp.]
MSILIKNGRIITASADYTADVFIEGERISHIGENLNIKADEVIDAAGKLVMPGGIDPHVHLDMPFMGTFSSDNYETGTLAALHGGTTTVIDFILQKQGKSLKAAYDEWTGRANGNAYGDYSFHIAVTDFNNETQKEISYFINELGITSFKTFMAYKGALMIDDRQMVGLMNEVKKHGGMVTVHATNGDMIDYLVAKHKSEGKLSPLYHYLSQPEITESEATSRFADMAFNTGVPAYIVHMTCEGSLNAVRRAQLRNQKVYAETCIQYLLLDASLYEKDFEGAKWVMSPPLREKKDQTSLWGGINQGIVQIVATDHCPFNWEQKLMGKDDFSKIPNGHPAIENRMELLFSEGVNKGKISLNKYVEVTSTNSAKIFGMFPRKGTIGIGADADIIIFNPNEEHALSAKSHHMNVDYSGYEGWKLKGKCKQTILRGKLAVDNGKVRIDKGYGKFIKREKHKEVV